MRSTVPVQTRGALQAAYFSTNRFLPLWEPQQQQVFLPSPPPPLINGAAISSLPLSSTVAAALFKPTIARLAPFKVTFPAWSAAGKREKKDDLLTISSSSRKLDACSRADENSDSDDVILRSWVEKHFTLYEQNLDGAKRRRRRNNKLPFGSDKNQTFSATCRHTGTELTSLSWSGSRGAGGGDGVKILSHHLVTNVRLQLPQELSEKLRHEMHERILRDKRAVTKKKSKMMTQNHHHRKIPDWSYDESFYNALVDGLGMEIRTDPVKGKGLFATKFFEEGEAVFSEPALCCIQDLEEYKNEAPVCAHCMKSLESPEEIVTRVCCSSESESHQGKKKKKQKVPPLPHIDGFRTGREYIYCRNHGSHEENKTKNNSDDDELVGCREVYCSERCASAAWKQHHYVMCPGRMTTERRRIYNQFLDRSWDQGGVDYSDAHFFAMKFIAMVLTRRRMQQLPLEHCFAPVAQLIRVPLDRFHLNSMLESLDDEKNGKGEEGKGGEESPDQKYERFLKYKDNPKEDPLYVENQEGYPKSKMIDEAWSMICQIFEITEEEQQFLTRDRWSELVGAVMLNAQERAPDSPYVEYTEYLKTVAGSKAVKDLEQKLTTCAAAGGGGGKKRSSRSTTANDANTNSNKKNVIEECWVSSKGQGIYTIGACFNHSCDPNLEIQHTPENDESICAVAIKDIYPGEEMTISYLGNDVPWKERRAHLFEHYQFDCLCSLCKEEQQQQRHHPTQA